MLLHIPHSSTAFPTWATGRVPAFELELMTDWFTDQLFQHPAADRFVFPWSRYVCDVERLIDDPLEAKGQGRLYTHLRNGTQFRWPSDAERDGVHALYDRWHRRLRTEAGRLASLLDRNAVVDCHSFCASQVDLAEDGLPDVCIGVNTTTDEAVNEVVKRLQATFDRLGLTTAVNFPYGGAIEPVKDSNTVCVMLEVNKRMYLGDDLRPGPGFARTHEAMTAALETIHVWEQGG